MSTSTLPPSPAATWPRRLTHSAPVRLVAGVLAGALPVAVTMGLAQHLVEKPYRQLWPHLLAAVLCLLAYRAFVRVFEQRTPAELAPKPALRELPAGVLVGVALIGSVCAVLAVAGGLRVTGLAGGNLLKPLADMVLAAVVEEIVFRAVVLRILAAWLGTRTALVVSSLLFALAHLPNNGFSAMAFAALVVAGLLLAAAYLVHQRVWLPIGLHFGWNFTTEGLFSLASSGQAAQGYLQTQLAGPEWLTGGAFGVEASVVTVAITALATGLLLAYGRRVRNGRLAAHAA